MTKQLTLADVKKHKGQKSVWIIIHNDVYDVTKFLTEHPGGPEALLDVAGEDGTQAFEDVGHSKDAREMMKKYKIGTLPVGEQTKFIDTCCPRIPKMDSTEKTWRTYDGSSGREKPPKSSYKSPTPPRVERRVQTVIVPRERLSSKWKWALFALAGAVIIGIVLKKYVAK